ncbi:hypothetical protein PAMP_017899 [Pampus punctatissimus]
MSSSSANLHNKRLPSETECAQRLPDVDAAQQLKLRERQRFFEEVFQHDVDVYLSSAHLCIRDYKRPPIGSVSSMEVNVDLLDQMELIDISDQEALDVFFSSGGEEGVLTSPLPVQGNNNNEEGISNGLFRHVLEGLEAKSRMSSTSSNSSSDSQTTNANGRDTPVVRSDDEETHSSTVKLRAMSPEIDMICYLSSASCSDLLNRPRRAWIIDSFSIEEGQKGPFPMKLGKIHLDRQYLVYFELHGEGVNEEPVGLLSIDRKTGTMYVHSSVDYEKKQILRLKFEAKKADLSPDTLLGVEISIRDINDNPPRFLADLYNISVKEDTAQGSNLMTVVATDLDQAGTLNSTFHYEIKSVTPDVPDTQFYIEESGMISFKGCLDYEASVPLYQDHVADKFTIVVEAIDHGEVVSLSSSTTVVVHVQVGNNNLPSITKQTGTRKVMEQETGSSPLRLHVTDKDTEYTPAWRAKYTIHGDKGGHFKIETDPETNDGILTVVKPLDFEKGAERELSISVENEMPYFSCKVREKTSSGLWKVDTVKGDDGAVQPNSVKVIIEVEDTNDPPFFKVTVKDANIEENAPTGTWVEKVTAVDPDSKHEQDFVYSIGYDPEGWLTVDPHTGDITTIKSPDREAPHVINGVYTVLLHAVGNGEPPLTSTATLNIHVSDLNDNMPQLTSYNVGACVSDHPTTTNISAFDLDKSPYGGPFTFNLLGDVKGKWTLDPSHGYTAGLVKDPRVYAGIHKVGVMISDMQGAFAIYNLTVTVCDCSVAPDCRNRTSATITAAPSVIGIVFASLLLLLLLLLLAVVITCKKVFVSLPFSDSYGESLLSSNIEKPGTDCMVPDNVLVSSTATKNQDSSDGQSLLNVVKIQNQALNRDMKQNLNNKQDIYQFNSSSMNKTSPESTMSRNSQIANGSTLNHKRLFLLQETEEDLADYQPHHYADEGDSDSISELDNISILDNDNAFMKSLTDLDIKFQKLASICKPQQFQN